MGGAAGVGTGAAARAQPQAAPARARDSRARSRVASRRFAANARGGRTSIGSSIPGVPAYRRGAPAARAPCPCSLAAVGAGRGALILAPPVRVYRNPIKAMVWAAGRGLPRIWLWPPVSPGRPPRPPAPARPPGACCDHRMRQCACCSSTPEAGGGAAARASSTTCPLSSLTRAGRAATALARTRDRQPPPLAAAARDGRAQAARGHAAHPAPCAARAGPRLAGTG